MSLAIVFDVCLSETSSLNLVDACCNHLLPQQSRQLSDRNKGGDMRRATTLLFALISIPIALVMPRGKVR